MQHSEPTEAVVVLAAGRGVRMGGPKALMECNGAPWWRTQRARLAVWGARELWVVSDAVEEAMRARADQPEIVVGDSAAPMFASIALGIAHLRRNPPTGIAILPVDVPACSADVFRLLATDTDRPTVPVFEGHRGHPIRMPWSFVESAILPRIDDPTWTATARLDAIVRDAMVEVPVDDASVAVNLNTPEDLARWARGAGGSPPG